VPGARDAVEPELQDAPPRATRWSRARWRMWLRLALLAPPSLLLAWVLLSAVWVLVLAVLGTPVDAVVVERRAAGGSYTVTVEYPRADWSGRTAPARAVLELSMPDWGALVRVGRLPARRLGRGALQVLRVETGGRALDAASEALTVGLLVVPAVLGSLLLMWGRVAREWWLVTWGRPVRGRVQGRAPRARFARYAVAYEYRERTPRGAGATLHGRARLSRAQYDALQPGQPLTVLHSLWNPRWHVAYPYARFAARPGAPAWARRAARRQRAGRGGR
jgi:hypothetical protein